MVDLQCTCSVSCLIGGCLIACVFGCGGGKEETPTISKSPPESSIPGIDAELANRAEGGDADAQFEVAENLPGYRHGLRLEWYLKAAENGNAQAQFFLGREYDNGWVLELEPDVEQAIYWYRRAAENGHAGAQFIMSLAYEDGSGVLDGGVPQDEEERLKWLKMAAENGNPSAQRQYAISLFNHPDVEKRMIAYQMFKRSAEQGDFLAMYDLGDLLHGRSDPHNEEEAFTWYLKAAEATGEDRWASHDRRVAFCYMYGTGVAEDRAKAFEWYRRGADHDELSAFAVGECYEKGRGVEIDIEKAIHWYRKSAEAGFAEASEKLVELEGK